MKPKLIVIIGTFLSLVSLPLSLRQTKLMEYVAEIESSPESSEEELLDVFDLISELDSGLGDVRKKPDEKWARNLFKPVTKRSTITKKKSEKQMKGPLPQLTSIMVNQDGCYAILDNQIVQTGDVVKNMKVTKIEMGKVTLGSGDQTFVLTVD